jgi:Peptidase C39 family
MKSRTAILLLSSLCLVSIPRLARTQGVGSSYTDQVKANPVFTTPFQWAGGQPPPESESADLLAASASFQTGGLDAGIDALEGFLAAHPQSAWAPSLNLGLGQFYRNEFRLDLALSRWETAWETTRTNTDRVSQELAATAAARLAALLGGLGQSDKLQALLGELDEHPLPLGVNATVVNAAHTRLALMKHQPGEAYLCGLAALNGLAADRHLDAQLKRWLLQIPSPKGGFSLADLIGIAQTNGIVLAAARRPAGADLPLPCVIHWNLNHFATALEKRGDRYRVNDPSFGNDLWIQAGVIDSDASDAVLAQADNIPPSWNRLTGSECRNIRGGGYAPVILDPDDDACGGPCGAGDSCEEEGCDLPAANDGAGPIPPPPCCGMPQWRVSEPYTSLWLHDTPLFYHLSNGRWMQLLLSYKQRGEDRGANVGGFGPNWSCNLLGMIETDPNSVYQGFYTNYLAGGGFRGFATNGALDYKTAATVTAGPDGTPVMTAASRAVIRYAYYYGYPTLTTNYFVTRREDRFGRAIVINYQTVGQMVRPTTISDIDGQTITLAYDDARFPNRITSATDPYRRAAHFYYDTLGRLAIMVDMAGMSNTFQYDS